MHFMEVNHTVSVEPFIIIGHIAISKTKFEIISLNKKQSGISTPDKATSVTFISCEKSTS